MWVYANKINNTSENAETVIISNNLDAKNTKGVYRFTLVI